MPVENPANTLTGFRKTLAAAAPPAGLDPALEALWWEAKGDWKQAHEIAQAHDDTACAWVHAYLHRVEGDLGNAGYWYRRAHKPAASGALAGEWQDIAASLLRSAAPP